MVIRMFATSLTLHGGTLMHGWSQIVLDGGGHLHRDSFITRCAAWGITMRPAKWLFAVLDHQKTKYLTEFDDVRFLAGYDPGPLDPEAAFSMSRQMVSGSGSASKPFHIKGADQLEEGQQPFDLHVVLTREEFEQYQQQLRTKQMVAGIDLAGEARREEKNRTEERLQSGGYN